MNIKNNLVANFTSLEKKPGRIVSSITPISLPEILGTHELWAHVSHRGNGHMKFGVTHRVPSVQTQNMVCWGQDIFGVDHPHI